MGLHTCMCNRMSSSRYLPMHVQRNGVAYACESKRGCAKGSGWCTWVSVHGGRQKVAYMYVCTVLCKWMGLHKCVHAHDSLQGWSYGSYARVFVHMGVQSSGFAHVCMYVCMCMKMGVCIEAFAQGCVGWHTFACIWMVCANRCARMCLHVSVIAQAGV